jgi:dTDP-4-amino-4,6-dideoxygalactose transaminase
MGLTSLEAMEKFIALNERNYQLYREFLAGIPGVRLLEYRPSGRFNYQYVVADVSPRDCPLARDRLLDVLWAENVVARRYFYPGVHRMEPYRTLFPEAAAQLPTTERIGAGVLVLPTGETTTPEEIERVCEIIRVSVQHGNELTRRLEGSPYRLHREMIR